MNFITSLMMKQRTVAWELNKENILNCFTEESKANLLDLGCDDGVWTKKIAEKIKTDKISGIELIEERAQKAREIGIKVEIADLNSEFPYKNDMFDVIHTNQVIEHVKDTDLFVSEIHRILKPGGYAVVSTENLASWHNIGATILGYMPFSLVNVSNKTASVGNPLAPHNNEEFWESDTWQHVRVFTTKGLKHLFELFGFKVENIYGAGYYPLGNFFSKLDPWHSAFITFKIKKI
ncbi:MAG: class I SAM-dependent methyltransferase [Candidatus Delongbacteria bacterium]|nr:class I SAM-dependent methyltransferase [Candidatus Delongbacteria bacterium]